MIAVSQKGGGDFILRIMGFKNWLKKGAKKLFEVEPLNDPDEAERRFKICRGCDKFDGEKCKVCGCFMEVKVTMKKHRELNGDIRWTHCPEGKWGDKELAEFYNT